MTAAQAIRMSEIGDRFEWAWRKGDAPRIELFLSEALPEERCQLLEDLLRIELELRRADGDCPGLEEYRERFPAAAELVERVFGEEDRPPPPLQSVGKYQLLEEIGRGREGIVYRACEDGIAPLEVAVKLLGAGAVSSRADAERFIKEVRALARIEHEHIVPYRGSGDDRGQLYYVMRYIRGSNLAQFMAGRHAPLGPFDAARLMIQVAEAVCHLHAQQRPIVHRDLKPKNILLDEAGKVYVADFGLALLLDGDGGGVEGSACGTFPYIAPEQFDPRFGEVGPACDIYSLGVILYELITGEPPFPETPEAILLTLQSEPTPPRQLRAGIPKDLERICLKCLRKSVQDRYASAEQLRDDLEHFERGKPLPTPPDGPWPRLSHWARREPALAARLGVILVCSAIMWGYRFAVGYVPLAPDHWAKFLERSGTLTANPPILVWTTQVIFIAWACASWYFQRRLNTRRDQGGLQLGWRIADVIALALIIVLDDALMSPLTVAFAVLIVASAFWARADQILHTTLLSMLGYIILALNYHYNHPAFDRSYRHFHYLVVLALLGLMLMHQANRTRALARICGERN